MSHGQYSDAQWELAATVKFPRPCRVCWIWATKDPPAHLMYQKCDYTGVWIKPCMACSHKVETFEWILAIPPEIFEAWVWDRGTGFHLDQLRPLAYIATRSLA